ncbi:MAG: tetratricopeptide repeat protein [Deltaproteobacteria bacterium]|nr:tetratricopeptide repeat protein [Deltaproteobacteria bacterium]
MRDPDEILDAIGKRAIEALGEGPDTPRQHRQARRFMSALEKKRRVRTRAPLLAAAAAVTAVFTITASLFWKIDQAKFRVDGVSQEGGGPIVLRSLGEKPIEFSFDDGSLVRLEKSSIGGVFEASRRKKTIVLGSGTISAEIKHASSNEMWVFEAGPYRATVVGTSFSMTWAPAHGKLGVAVFDGKVEVRGFGIQEKGVTVEKGHHLLASGKPGSVSITVLDRADGLDPADTAGLELEVRVTPPGGVNASPHRVDGHSSEGKGPGLDEPTPGRVSEKQAVRGGRSGHGLKQAANTESAPPSPSKTRVESGGVNPPPILVNGDRAKPPSQIPEPQGRKLEETAEPPESKVALLPAPPAWKDLYSKGRYTDALADAERLGFEVLLSTHGADDLWSLANTARYAKRPDMAVRALVALRKRFSEVPHAKTAAFLLGKIEFENNNHPAEAAAWFRTFLGEEPDGSLSAEAMGRLIDACLRSGQKAEARDTARRYLAKYPRGAYAELAAFVLGE